MFRMRFAFTAFCVASCVVVGCAADTFVGGDGAAGDAGPQPVTIACASSSTCTAGQACCVSLTNGWSSATCQPDTNEGKLGCERYLSCSDAADCPTGQVCCATTILPDGGGQTIVSTQCLASCSGANMAQLCNKNAPTECLTGTCNDWNGNPSWVLTCQQ